MHVTRSSITLALASLLWAAGAVAQTKPEAAKGASPGGGALPPGPHVLITVPLVLTALPPEVNQYEINCAVFAAGGRGSAAARGTALGKGVAVGPTATPGARPGEVLHTDVVVEVFLNDPSVETLAQVDFYRCHLVLSGTANGHTQRYTGEGLAAPMPIAAGSHPRFEASGPVPP
jgi:hypothetical protein